MHVTRFSDAPAYDARGHFNMTGVRLQGFNVSPTRKFWVSISHFQPGGGAEFSSSPVERVYVVLEGQITVTTEAGEATLGVNDSCYLPPGEKRSVANRGSTVAEVLVIVEYQPGQP